MATIATHNGSSLSQGHNRRDERYTSKDGHINPNGLHEIWFDKDIKEMYHDLFDEAVQAFNQEEKKADRKIADYYQKIRADKQKHLAYETIIGVYKTGDTVSDETKKEILKEYCCTWEERNPNLKLLGIYYHADEPGEPHVHIDYIPVASYAKGLKLRNGIKRALEEQGFTGETKKTNPVKQWTKRENEYLEKLCNDRGIEIDHDIEKRKHLSVKGYKEVNDYIKQEEKKADEKIQAYVNEEVGKQTQERMEELEDSLRLDMPSRKGIFKKYSKKDIETLESQVMATKVIENELGMPISSMPKYIQRLKKRIDDKNEEIKNINLENNSAQDNLEIKISDLEEALENANKNINSLQFHNNRLKKQNNELLEVIFPGATKTENQETQKKENREKTRNHNDFDLER